MSWRRWTQRGLTRWWKSLNPNQNLCLNLNLNQNLKLKPRINPIWGLADEVEQSGQLSPDLPEEQTEIPPRQSDKIAPIAAEEAPEVAPAEQPDVETEPEPEPEPEPIIEDTPPTPVDDTPAPILDLPEATTEISPILAGRRHAICGENRPSQTTPCRFNRARTRTHARNRTRTNPRPHARTEPRTSTFGQFLIPSRTQRGDFIYRKMLESPCGCGKCRGFARGYRC